MKTKEKILIIGGSGYIGTATVDFLKQNYQVICIDNLLYGQKSVLKKFQKKKNFQFFNIDLRNKCKT